MSDPKTAVNNTIDALDALAIRIRDDAGNGGPQNLKSLAEAAQALSQALSVLNGVRLAR